MSVIVYGIKNCDTVQRALQALDTAGIAYQFHDFKKQGLDVATAQRWIDAHGVDTVVNRKGTTWRKLDEATRSGLTASTAAALLSREPSLVKRPVIAHRAGLTIGFAKGDEAAVIDAVRAGAG